MSVILDKKTANCVVAFVSTIKSLKGEGANKKYLYRGQENVAWELVPTIQRGLRENRDEPVSDEKLNERHKLERKMLNDLTFISFKNPTEQGCCLGGSGCGLGLGW